MTRGLLNKKNKNKTRKSKHKPINLELNLQVLKVTFSHLVNFIFCVLWYLPDPVFFGFRRVIKTLSLVDFDF